MNRDLRITDNTAIYEASLESDYIFPIFIFDPIQMDSKKNPYFSEKGFYFMCSSIDKIKENVSIFYGDTIKIIEKIIKKYDINIIFMNKDYTPFAIKRENSIQELCKKINVECRLFSDAILVEPEWIIKKDGGKYTKFTPFYNKAKEFIVRKPRYNHFNKRKLNSEKLPRFKRYDINPEKILNLANDFKEYDKEKDFPALSSTTHLSPHIKFGTISIREAYHKIANSLGKTHPLIRQLYWREFWIHIAYNFPHIFKGSFYKKYDKIEWNNDKKRFKAWCDGNTGFPIVDAGMRELNTTGYMHNRIRMIVSSFLTKDLHIDWKKGERYFAKKLIDYDPAVNNGNWQWSASTGCDMQPYFRIFNPWVQQHKYDSECEYIKKWIPELKDKSIKQIHSINKSKEKIEGYNQPIVNHDIQKEITKKKYKNI